MFYFFSYLLVNMEIIKYFTLDGKGHNLINFSTLCYQKTLNRSFFQLEPFGDLTYLHWRNQDFYQGGQMFQDFPKISVFQTPIVYRIIVIGYRALIRIIRVNNNMNTKCLSQHSSLSCFAESTEHRFLIKGIRPSSFDSYHS